MAGTVCVRCQRGTFSTAGRLNLRTLMPLCDDCAEIVFRTKLPEIHAAILEVLR